jgi:hypothetical protein
MVETYWNIEKQIYEAQGENQRAKYGKGMLKFLAEKLTKEFGKGFTVANLKNNCPFGVYRRRTRTNSLESGIIWW